MAQHPSLRRLLQSLQRAAADSRHEEVAHLGKEAARLIKLKRERFLDRYQIDLKHWDRTLQYSPEQICSFIDDPALQLLLAKDVQISYSMLPKSPLLYCPQIGKSVDVVQNKVRLIFNNPITHLGDSNIESWARPSSKSREYKKHLFSSSNPKASRYLRDIDVENLEYALFDRPIGILVKPNQLLLYAAYDKEIGKLTGGVTTKFVAMQCDRVRRPKGTGFFTEVHSYPVAESEVTMAFQGASSLRDRVFSETLTAK